MWCSIDVDLHYTDGAQTYGTFEPFSTGVHGWEMKELVVAPEKPLAAIVIHLLFADHSGLVRFAAASAYQEQQDAAAA